MAGIDLATAQTQLDAALAALTRARQNASYSIANRSYTQQSLDALQKDVDYWNNKVIELTEDNSGIVISQITPMD